MTVNEILIIAAELVGESDVAVYLSGKAPQDAEYCKNTVALFKRCYDITVDELACEFFPLLQTEKVSAADGKIFYKDLLFTPLRIRNVRCENGEKCAYKLNIDYLSVNKPHVEIVYEYRPKKQKLTDTAYYTDGILGEYGLSYGIAAEFCLERGRITDADIWQNKYAAAVKGRLRERKNLKIPARNWY